MGSSSIFSALRADYAEPSSGDADLESHEVGDELRTWSRLRFCCFQRSLDRNMWTDIEFYAHQGWSAVFSPDSRWKVGDSSTADQTWKEPGYRQQISVWYVAMF
jgi:hypothetical protein